MFSKIKILLYLLNIFLHIFSNTLNAQNLNFNSNNDQNPIEVSANKGIEWQREEKIFIARGSAKAIQGDIKVYADELIAHYRDIDGQNTDVYRVDALGNVIIYSKNETARGSAAVYDFEKDVLVMEGSPSILDTPDGKVISYETIQFWGKDDIALAKGNAQAERDNNKLFADMLVARFQTGNEKSINNDNQNQENARISMIEGYGNVRLETKSGEVILGERGKYDLISEVAILDGNVRVKSENSQMKGGFAVIDTSKGVSTLYPSAIESGYPRPGQKPRVSAVLVPKPKRVKNLIDSDS